MFRGGLFFSEEYILHNLTLCRILILIVKEYLICNWGGIRVRRYLIFGLALIIIMGSLIAPKIIRGGKEGLIKFKQVSEEDIPEKNS